MTYLIKNDRTELVWSLNQFTFWVLKLDVFLASNPSMAVWRWRADLIALLDSPMFRSEYSFQSFGVKDFLSFCAGPCLPVDRLKDISLFFFGAVILRCDVCWSISIATSLSMRSFSKSAFVFCSRRISSAANWRPWFSDSWTPLIVATSN